MAFALAKPMPSDVVHLVVTPINRGGETAYRVRSPDVRGLGVVAPTRTAAIREAKEVAYGLRRSYGQSNLVEFSIS